MVASSGHNNCVARHSFKTNFHFQLFRAVPSDRGLPTRSIKSFRRSHILRACWVGALVRLRGQRKRESKSTGVVSVVQISKRQKITKPCSSYKGTRTSLSRITLCLHNPPSTCCVHLLDPEVPILRDTRKGGQVQQGFQIHRPTIGRLLRPMSIWKLPPIRIYASAGVIR
jgi:hypothetical protein